MFAMACTEQNKRDYEELALSAKTGKMDVT
jgi:hypothetical protein